MYITWSPPPLYLTNGIIDGYEIQYGRYDQGSGDIQVDIITLLIEGNNTFNHTIEDLQEYIEYGFRVRAVTVAPGPYSELVLNKTLQSGYCNRMQCLIYRWHQKGFAIVDHILIMYSSNN